MDASFAPPEEVSTPSPRVASQPSLRTANRVHILDETRLVKIRRYDAREAIFAAGDAAPLVYEIKEGAAMVSQRLPDGRRRVLDIVGPGRFLGLGTAARHDCSAEALTACVVRGYRKEDFETSPRTRTRVLQAMALDMRRMRQLLSINGRKYAMERIAAFLESLVDESAVDPFIFVPLSRGEMADAVGLTIETASRCVAKLKRLKVLGDEYGELMHVLDWPRLRELARGGDVSN